MHAVKLKDFSRYTPLFKNIISPDYLKVAAKPLMQGCIQTERLSLLDIQRVFGFHYTENVWCTTASENWELSFLKQACRCKKSRFSTSDGSALLIKLKHRLRHPLNEHLVVCKIDADVGYGVFTEKHFPEGSILGLYAGFYDDSDESHDELKDTRQLDYFAEDVDAKYIGGITRFIQHMPSDAAATFRRIDNTLDNHDLTHQAFIYGISLRENNFLTPMNFLQKKTYLKQRIKERYVESYADLLLPEYSSIASLATANTILKTIMIDDVKFSVIVTTRPIEAYEQIGLDYSRRYWCSRKLEPKHFDKHTGYVLKCYKPEASVQDVSNMMIKLS